MNLTNLRQKDDDACLQTQIDHAKRTCTGDVPNSQIAKYFPKDTKHPLNKWNTASSEERMIMLINNDVLVLMGIDS